MKKSTMELMDILKNTKNISDYIEAERSELIDSVKLGDYINNLIEEKQLKKSDLIKRSGLDRAYAYDIMTGRKEPSRDKVLALCIAMQLNIDEVQKLLRCTGYPNLYTRIERDSVILFAIQKGLSIDDTNNLLYEMEFDCLN